MPAPREVWVSGIGAISPWGLGTETLWRAAVGQNPGSAIQDGLRRIPEAALAQLQAKYPDASAIAKPSLIALDAAKQAMNQAGWESLSDSDGLIVGTTAGEIPLWEERLIDYRLQRGSAADCAEGLRHQPLGAVTETLSRHLSTASGFRGRSLVTSSACSASTQAIALGALWIQMGWVERCLVGGTEVLARLTVEGFKSLQLLSPEPSRPFDVNRKGINLSEGAGFLCLEAAPRSSKRLARVSGFGLSSDAYHLTAPHPEGKGILKAMSGALDRAGLQPGDIDWVHAHGTGSQANDVSEGSAIEQLFGVGDSSPWVSSTKGCHGHALGAAGALESVLSVMALRSGTILPTAGLREPDPAIRVRHPRAPLQADLRHVLKTTLGFGGNNAALVFSHPDTTGVRS